MLPIRRLAGDLREVRWGHVLVEFVMLVVGILLALAVNNGVEDRRDARIERQYLERLVRDFDADLALLAESSEFERGQVADGVRAWRALGSPAAITDREAVAEALADLGARRTLRLTRAAYMDLTSTGNLRLIRDGALRDRIVGLYEENDRVSAIIDRNNQFYVDQMYAAFLAEDGLVARRAGGNVRQLRKANEQLVSRMGGAPGVQDDRLWALPPDATAWFELRNRLWMRTLVSQSALSFFDSTIERTLAARAAVVEELDRRWPGAGKALGKPPAS
ncbi:MAG: hypothetical protein U1F08_01140 [Steroidobacteraceae bacterium]